MQESLAPGASRLGFLMCVCMCVCVYERERERERERGREAGLGLRQMVKKRTEGRY